MIFRRKLYISYIKFFFKYIYLRRNRFMIACQRSLNANNRNSINQCQMLKSLPTFRNKNLIPNLLWENRNICGVRPRHSINGRSVRASTVELFDGNSMLKSILLILILFFLKFDVNNGYFFYWIEVEISVTIWDSLSRYMNYLDHWPLELATVKRKQAYRTRIL